MTASLGAARKQRIDDLAGAAAKEGGVSLLLDAWRRVRVSPVFWVGAVIIAVFLLLAAFANVIATQDPSLQLLRGQVSVARNQLAPAQPGFPWGSDFLGRDLFSRMVLASRQTLLVGVAATLLGLIGGMILGMLAGALGGWVDGLVMRVVDVMLSLPSILLATSIAVLFTRPNQLTVIIAVATVQVPIFARLLRGQMLAQRHSDHVLAATALGVKRGPIVFRHMLPNSMSPVIVQATIVVATSIIEAAGLSFLGLGSLDASAPEWGQMLGEAYTKIDYQPHLAFLPATAIIIVALGFTLLGESLREALDPKNRR
jgi:peptide/nickel transport system permease protein